MKRITLCCLLFIQFAVPLSASGPKDDWIVPQRANADASFRGITVVNENEAWVSGSGGVVVRTVDGGKTWSGVSVPNSGQLDFRDIEVLQQGVVVLMSAGPGEQSRIFRSSDHGDSWTTILINHDAAGFFNALSFSDFQNGILIGDPVDGHLDIYRTRDGGATWRREQGPRLQKGEYGFAASGSSVASMAPDYVWVATGGSVARVFRRSGPAQPWTSVETLLAHGKESSGIFSIAFRDPLHGVIVGGDYRNPDVDDGNVARTADGGVNWTLAGPRGMMPHKACVRHITKQTWMTVGRTGVAISRDDGASWKHVSSRSYYTFDTNAETSSGWMAGSDGRIARFTLPAE